MTKIIIHEHSNFTKNRNMLDDDFFRYSSNINFRGNDKKIHETLIKDFKRLRKDNRDSKIYFNIRWFSTKHILNLYEYGFYHEYFI